VRRSVVWPLREELDLRFAKQHQTRSLINDKHRSRWVLRAAAVAVLAAIAYAVAKVFAILATMSVVELRHLVWGAGATFLRVETVLLLAALWTVPVGVVIGLRPKLSAIAQPIAQIAASVPATALFPIILIVLIRAGGGLGIGSIVLLLLGTQWYMLFNVIAGATAIPADLKEVCHAYQLSTTQRWRRLFLPAIFPYLITGFVTASGGAWNASIVAEYFHFRGQTISTTGLGAIISQATDSGNFRLLLAATVAMAVMVVTINRLVWRPLYALASTRFKLEC
jgi:NitT/TauT family transport system permease protein